LKSKKLALIAITLIVVVFSVGCDEASMIDNIITDGSEETNQLLAELKAEPNGVITDVERERILNFPGVDATPEDFESHAEVVESAAVDSNVLDITSCKPNPLVLRVGYGGVVEIKNEDPVSHTISHHRGGSVTIPGGGSVRVVVTDFLKSKRGSGFTGYTCDGVQSGLFYIKSEPTTNSFRVVLDGNGGSGVRGVTVTVLDGSGEVTKTDNDGNASLRGNLPFMVRLEKPGHFTTEGTITKEGEEFVFPAGKVEVTFRVVKPLPKGVVRPGVKGATVIYGGERKVTNTNGEVTFFGNPPLLSVRIEKLGHPTIETEVGRGGEIPLPNEWPEEVFEAIRQLELTKQVESGWLTLTLEDKGYLPTIAKETGNDGLGGTYACQSQGANIVVRDYKDWNFVLSIIVHELMHTRQGLVSINPPCDGYVGWIQSEDGKAWIEATEKDLETIGPVPGVDDQIYGGDRLLSEMPWENQAVFYSWWYMGGFETKILNEVWNKAEEREKLSRLAPNRYRLLVNLFGSPPS